ncbi:MAG: hypothetical protein H7Y30_18095 [Pyrinomonadaceae bacterium]|nr:hypothetical protein [Pyrinomonadaceae bacterium]
MSEKFSQVTNAALNITLPLKLMLLVALVAAMAVSSSAQTQSTTGTDEAVAAMITSTKTDPAISASASKSLIGLANAPKKPSAQGAGSENNAYIFVRGYAFSVNRSGGNPAVISSSGGGAITAIDNFDYGTEGAVKFEAGWNGPHWGFRGSYFYTTQSAQEDRTGTAAAPFFVSPRPLNVTFTGFATANTPATFRERFRLHVVDLEGTYKWFSPDWSVVLSAGVRIAPSRQTYTAQDTFGAATTENLNYTQKRTGVGPTAAIDFRHRLGKSNWWITGDGRLAVLFGKLRETATFSNSGGFSQTATRSDSRTTFVGEGELGLEYSWKFGSGNEFFLNGSFIVHHWNDIVNVMPVNPVGGSAFTTLDNPAAASTRQGSLTFTGGAFSFGIRW